MKSATGELQPRVHSKFWHITAFLKIKREKYKNLQTKSVTTSPGLPCPRDIGISAL